MMPVGEVLHYDDSFVDCELCEAHMKVDFYRILLTIDSDKGLYKTKYLCHYCYKFIRGELK